MTKIRIKDEDYLYASARVRARAAAGTERADIVRMCEAKDVSEVYRIMSERGINLVGADGSSEPDIEATLDAYLCSEFDTVQSFAPDNGIYGILRYQYDAHNLKTAIKSELRGRSPQDVYIDLGTVGAAKIDGALADRDFSLFPSNMKKAAAEALEVFSKTSDPQQIDLLIDKACFADMLSLALRIKKPFFADIVRTKIDVTNILTAIRIIKLSSDSNYFKECYIEGGTLAPGFFDRMIGAGKDGYTELIANTAYSYIAASLKSGGRLSDAERACENCYIDKLRASYSIAYGAEVPFSYLALKDTEVRNIRIIVISKKVGQTPSEIQTRLRGI